MAEFWANETLCVSAASLTVHEIPTKPGVAGVQLRIVVPGFMVESICEALELAVQTWAKSVGGETLTGLTAEQITEAMQSKGKH